MIFQLEPLLIDADGIIRAAEESRKPAAYALLRTLFHDLDSKLPPDEAEALVRDFSLRAAYTLAESIDRHESRDEVNRRIVAITGELDETVTRRQQQLRDARDPVVEAKRWLPVLSDHLWGGRECHNIETLLEPGERIQSVDWYEVKTDKRVITRVDVRLVNRAYSTYPDDERWEANFVSLDRVASEIARRRQAEEEAAATPQYGVPGPRLQRGYAGPVR